MKKDAKFLEYLKKSTVSYDGFTSFYDYNQAITNKDNILTQYIFKYLAQLFNKNCFNDYYHSTNIYELIYNISNMPTHSYYESETI